MTRIIRVIALAFIFVLSGCEAIKQQIKIENIQISYDGARLFWDEVENAEYTLTINDDVYNLTNPEVYLTIDEDFDLSLSVVLNGKTIKTITKHFTKLDTIDDLQFLDGKITWDYINGASRYCIKINEKIVQTELQQNFYEITEAGILTITVRPLSDDLTFFSNWSNIITLDILPQVKKVEVDHMQNAITWERVDKATSYQLLINDEKHIVLDPFFSLENYQEDLNIKIKALSDKAIESNYTPTYLYKYIPQVTNIRTINGILVWDQNMEDEKYMVVINESNPIIIEEAKYCDLESEVINNVKIYPVSSYQYYSKWTSTNDFSILKKPSITCDVTALSEIVMWDKVENATHYKIEILSDTVVYYNDYILTHHLFIGGICCENKEYTINITALAADKLYVESKVGQITVIRLASPTSYKVNEQPDKTDATIVTIDPVTNASEYTFRSVYASLIKIDQRSFCIADSLKDEEEIIITVSANGYYDQLNCYYLESLIPLQIVLKREAIPKNIKIVDNTLIWDKTASEYIVLINQDVYNTKTEKMELNLTEGNYQISIRSVGTNNTISSAFSLPLTIEKPAAPRNVDVNNLIITWEGEASKYVVLLDDKETIVDTTKYIIKEESIKSETTIKVKIKGDNIKTLDSVYSEELTIYKLATPTNVTLFQNTIRWIAPYNKYPEKYQLYIDSKMALEIENNVVEASIFTDAKTYTLSIKAIGNNKTTYDSSVSEVITIVKLNTISKYTIANNKLLIEEESINGYEVKVNNIIYFLSNENKSFSLPEDIKTIEIRVLGDDAAGIISSDWKEVEIKKA